MCSKCSVDNETRTYYDRLSTRVPNSDTFLRVFLNRDFNDVYKLISRNIFQSGQHSIRAESHLQLTFVDAILGLPANSNLKALYQVQHKKMAITLNEIMTQDCDFMGVGDDQHVHFVLREFYAKFHLTKSKYHEVVLATCRTMPPEIGWWANEIIGQLRQLLIKSVKTREVAKHILSSLAISYPQEYDVLLDKLVDEKQWSRTQRNESNENVIHSNGQFSSTEHNKRTTETPTTTLRPNKRYKDTKKKE